MGKYLRVVEETVEAVQMERDGVLHSALASESYNKGDWIVTDRIGSYVETDENFKACYQPVAEEDTYEENPWDSYTEDDWREAYTESAMAAGTLEPDYVNPFKEDSEDKTA